MQEREQKEVEYAKRREELEKTLFQNLDQKTAEIKKEFLELEEKYQKIKEIEHLGDLREAKEQLEKEFARLSAESELANEMLRKEVRKNEEDYIQLVENCHKEYEDIVDTARIQSQELKTKASEFLRGVEQELMVMRQEVIKKNQEEVYNRFQYHEKAEASFLKRRTEEEEKKNARLRQLKQEKNREFFDLKIFHENEIQNHEKCLEDMKAIYQLNAEKLNYNFKVLSDKKDENTALAAVLKKKERFFLNLLKRKNDEFFAKDLEFRQSNKRLTEQSKKFTK